MDRLLTHDRVGYRRRSTGIFRFNLTAVADLFRHRSLWAAACGYFGHMWELYTLWAFVPLFSTIVARTSPRELVGSALTLANCIGFSITVVSLSPMQWVATMTPMQYLLLMLAAGR